MNRFGKWYFVYLIWSKFCYYGIVCFGNINNIGFDWCRLVIFIVDIVVINVVVVYV